MKKTRDGFCLLRKITVFTVLQYCLLCDVFPQAIKAMDSFIPFKFQLALWSSPVTSITLGKVQMVLLAAITMHNHHFSGILSVILFKNVYCLHQNTELSEMLKAAKCRLGDLPVEKHGKKNGYECNKKKLLPQSFCFQQLVRVVANVTKRKRHPGSNTDCG